MYKNEEHSCEVSEYGLHNHPERQGLTRSVTARVLSRNAHWFGWIRALAFHLHFLLHPACTIGTKLLDLMPYAFVDDDEVS